MKPESSVLKSDLVPVPGSDEKPLVLVVDDELSICDTLCKVLEDENFRADFVTTGEEAIGRIIQTKPALVFLDIWLPGWDGIETLKRIKDISPGTQVIMISGHATIANALEATKRGAFDFIEKPLDIESVILSATRALQKHETTTDADSVSADSGSPVLKESSESQTTLATHARLTHPGLLSRGLAGKNIGQRTLGQSAILYGQGLHSGQKSGLILEPLPVNSGIHFGKIGTTRSVPAYLDFVESTSFATTVRHESTVAATIEHLLAALHAYKISNLLIKCNGEVPICDGSANEFCRMIEQVGVEEQGGDWFEVAVDKKVVFAVGEQQDEFISIEPAEQFEVLYRLDYPEPAGTQFYRFVLAGPESFKQEIAPARTFGFLRDIERLQRAGLAAGGRLDNFILIGEDNIINTELRFTDELARHKILDVVGDLFLLGRPIRGRVTAQMSGHSDNINLLRELRSQII